MRLIPILTAILVSALLYMVVIERDTLTALMAGDAPEEGEALPGGAAAAAEAPDEEDTRIRVMAMMSQAREIDSAVVLRGQSEALRQVEVRAETSGKVISDPLRRGAFVEEGQLLCEIDPGTRGIALQEAQARLAEARARAPESRARTSEAGAQVPAAEARILEAEANVPAAEAALAEARARVPAAEAALSQAEAGRPEAEARLVEARSRVQEAEINLNAASQLAKEGFAAQTRLASAQAAYEASKAQVQTALAGVIGADAAVEAAKGQLEGAKAAVESAKAQVESARSAISSAKASLEGASAGIESAKAGEENALSGIQSAEAAVAAAEKEIERLSIHAPFAGLLETDTAELGALLQPGAACATIIQLNPIKITGYVPERDVSRVRLDAPAGARLVDGREVVGKVSFVSRSADPVTRTFRVELTVDNSDLTIRDGQTAEIAIEAEGAPGHLVPQSALTLDDEGHLGLRTVDENSRAKFLPVTLIRDTRDGALVSGLPDKIAIITVGQEYVTDGVPVEAVFEEVVQ
ncbi:efflux RND transporter periplasmic adaptor subunit [Primorskyibacter sp. 2E233]|uniref:efflux RND transporter periplasmic adaptor subunit n=1 Tax=Primorskyibacter sp. 2E233 TaxID=3413431 RepID=UPI003BF0030D